MEVVCHLSTVWVVCLLIALTCGRAGLAVSERAQTAHLAARTHALGEALESLIIAIAVVFLVVRPFVVQAFYIPSGSMHPTLVENDRILVDKLCYRLREPRRHDVVVFRAPVEATEGDTDPDDKDFVKRVVGLPGDTVEVRDGVTLVNGMPDSEPFPHEVIDYDLPPVVVPPHTLFVMGDNRNHSNDSHRWGALPRSLLVGRAAAIFWPPSRAGFIH